MKTINYYKLALVMLLVGLSLHLAYTQMNMDIIVEALSSLSFVMSFVIFGIYVWKFFHQKEGEPVAKA